MLQRSAGEAQTPFAVGPVLQFYPTPPTPFPATIAISDTWQSGIINADGFKAISVGVTSTQAGTLTIQRYVDQDGQVPVGAAITASIAASTPQWADVNDGVAFGSFQVSVSNGSGSAVATVSNISILQSAA